MTVKLYFKLNGLFNLIYHIITSVRRLIRID